MDNTRDLLLEEFKKFEKNAEAVGKLGIEEFQITVPIFGFTINVVRDCFDGTDCTYITYSDNGIGGIYDSFTWDEE